MLILFVFIVLHFFEINIGNISFSARRRRLLLIITGGTVSRRR